MEDKERGVWGRGAEGEGEGEELGKEHSAVGGEKGEEKERQCRRKTGVWRKKKKGKK